MYKLIIADDEEATRSRLLSLLEKEKDNFVVKGSYQNGYDVLEDLDSLSDVDIVITDIKMPFVTGLELAKNLKESYPLIQIIFLSGFDDFDYAKQAIQLDAVAYLLKPLSYTELKEALYKAKDRLDTTNQIDKDIKKAKEHNEALLKAEQNADLLKLITLKGISETFDEKLKNDGIDLKNKYIAFALFDPDAEEDSLGYEELELAHYYLEENLSQLFHNDIRFFTFGEVTSLGVLFLSDKPFNEEELELPLSTILAKLKRACFIPFSCAVSEISEPNKEMISYRKLFRHTRWALEYRTIMGKGLVLFYGDLASKEKKIGKVDDSDYKNIANALLYGRSAEAKELVKKIVLNISNIEFRDSYLLVLNDLLASILKGCVSIDKLHETYHSHIDLINEFYAKKGKESILEFLNTLIDKIVEINNGTRLTGIDTAYLHMKNYIEEHYQESDISVESLSKELGYSNSYVFAILKKQGTSFTRLLTSKRMEMAQRLLLDPNNKLAQIAHEIGYEDPYYFSHCFKKYMASHLRSIAKNEKATFPLYDIVIYIRGHPFSFTRHNRNNRHSSLSQ